MADVARAAGIGKGTIYEYFRSKEDLFFAVFQWIAEDTAKLSFENMKGTGAKKLEHINDRVIKKWLDQLPYYSLTLEFWSAMATPSLRDRFKQAFKDAYREFRPVIASILRDGIRRREFSEKIDADAVAAALVGSWDALILQTWFDSEFDALATSRHFLKVMIAGLKNA
jgi:AcrR family transcriptional regulator